MKTLFACLPLLLFFGSYRFAELDRHGASEFATRQLGLFVQGGEIGPTAAPVALAGTAVLAGAAVQLAWLALRRRGADPLLRASLALAGVLAAVSFGLHDDGFAHWKPSVLCWSMGLSFWLAPLLFGWNLPRLLLADQLQLPDRVWHRLNFGWVAFFGFMGLTHLWAAYSFAPETWLEFKRFGGLALGLLFVLTQAIYLNRQLKQRASEAP